MQSADSGKPGSGGQRGRRADPLGFTAVLLAGLSVVLAIVAFVVSCSASERQEKFQRDVEERQSAPLLVPGVPLDQRGKKIVFYPEAGGPLEKRADKLFLSDKPTRTIVPVRNAGEGMAILLGERFKLLESCDDAAIESVGAPDAPLGYYAVAPTASEQLGSLAPRDSELADTYRDAFRARQVFVLLRYTDVHRNKLRWTCIAYTRESTAGGWSLDYPVYGQKPWPASYGLE